ncbi:MAG: shikimate kinase [Lawsonibacter sp.]
MVAPGGSAVCREKAAEHLKTLGPVVYLKVPLEELSGRIQNLSTRGIAMEPGQTLADVLAYPRPPVRQICRPGHRLRRRTDAGSDRPAGAGAAGAFALTTPQPTGKTWAGRSSLRLNAVRDSRKGSIA